MSETEDLRELLLAELPATEIVHSNQGFVFASLVPGGPRQGRSWSSRNEAAKDAALALAALVEYDRLAKLSPQTYAPRPTEVEAMQVNAESAEEIARWCGGETRTSRQRSNEAETIILLDEMGTSAAFPGQWIIKDGDSIEVLSDAAFTKRYRAMR